MKLDDLGTTRSSKLQFPIVISNSKYGYKNTSGTFVSFRQPTGTATAAEVLSGYTFSNASSDSLTGSIPVRSNGTSATSAGKDTHGPYVYFPYGYYPQADTHGSYVYLTAAQATAVGGGGDVKHTVKVSYNHYTATAGQDIIIFYCYVDGKLVSNPSFNTSDENRIISAWSRTV